MMKSPITFAIFAQATIDDVSIPRTTFNRATIQRGVSFMLQLAAALSLVYVIIGAIRFTTSGGDPQTVASGRRTIILAMVGLVISVIALTITSFIQSTASQAASDANNPFFGSNGIITILIRQLMFVVGVASVIMIIIGAVRYITSAGQPQSAQAARNTIIYAVIGIIVALLGQLLVGLVLSQL